MHAAGFGADRGDGLVDHLLDQRQAVVGLADQAGGRHLDVLERDLRGAQAVDGRIVARRDALGLLVDEEDADALRVALAAARCAR